MHQYAEEVASSFCAALMSEALFPRFLFRWKVMEAVGLHVAEFAALLQPDSSQSRLGVFVTHLLGRFVTGSKT